MGKTMEITHEILEEYTGSRTVTVPDPENENAIKEVVDGVASILVKYTSDNPDIEYIKDFMIVLTEGVYDKEKTETAIKNYETTVALRIAEGDIT